MCKKLMSMVLCLCMLFGMLPAFHVEAVSAPQIQFVEKEPSFSIQSDGESQDSPQILHSGSCGASVTWTLDDAGTLTISGNGEMGNYEEGKAPWYSYRKQIETLVVESGVTTIGNGAFYKCTSLTSVMIPAGVTTIGEYAFRGCTALKEVEIPSSVTRINDAAFYECSKLETVSLPDFVYYIGYIAFSGTKLTEITIPNSVVNVGGRTFNSCPNLVYNEYENGRYLGSSTNPYMLLVSTIEDCTDFSIHPDTKVIGGYAFENADSLTTIELAEGLVSISDMAFNGCDDLKSISLPNSLIHIGATAFYCCYDLEEIQIPANVQSIGDGAFLYCTKLDGIWVDEANPYFSNDDQGVLYDFGKSVLYAAPVSGDFVIPFGVDTIAPRAFQGLGITSIEIPNTVRKIGEAAFFECAKLKKVILPDSVTTIGSSAFYKCTGMTKIELGASLEHIGDGAFSNCTSLSSITLPESVAYLGGSVFGYSGVTEIYFEGNIPTMDPYAFRSQTATAYYPMGYESWTEDVMLDYGGTITWVEYEKKAPLIASGTCGDNLTWELREDGVLTIAGTGDMWNYAAWEAPWVEQRLNIATVVIEDGVTSIGEYAFSYCQHTRNLEIGKDVVSIGQYAFYYASTLEQVVIPDNVTSVGEYAFYDCVSVKKAVIGSGLSTISIGMFKGCRELSELVISEGVKTIGQGAFSACQSLVMIVCPDSLTEIDTRALSACTSLTCIVLPAGVAVTGGSILVRWHILYKGTQEQWEVLGLYTEDSTVHFECSGTEVTDAVNKICSICIANCTHAYEEMVIEPTCTEAGYICQACPLCNDRYVTDTLEPTGHSGEWNLECKPSCWSSGWENRWCVVCGAYERKETPSPGHDYGEWAVYTEPGCLPGQDYRVCQVCGSYDFREVPGTGHSYVFEMTAEPTCTGYGFDLYRCTLCNRTTDDNHKEPLGHTYENLACIRCGEAEPVYEIDSGGCGTGVYWKLDNYGVLTIYGEGNIRDYSSQGPWIYEHAESIVKIVIEEGITGIGAFAFRYCAYVTSVTIPEGVTYIGESAFSQCTGLPRIDLPESLVTIGDYAFSWCEALRRIQIPSQVTNVSSGAFSYCSSLAQVQLPEDVTEIGDNAFYECTALESIVIPNATTVLGNCAFQNCTSLKDVSLGSGLTMLKGSVFSGCTALESIELPESLTYLGGSFTGCSSLKRIVLPAGITDIGYRYFSNCTALEEVVILGDVTEIGEYAFYYCTSLKSITLPDTVTIIDDYAFRYCSSLTSIIIPDSVTEIRSYAFADTKLTYAVLGNSVESIYGRAFQNCKYLTWIYVPKSLEKIGNSAFISCANLWHVLYQGTKEEWNVLINTTQTSTSNNLYLTGADRHYECAGNEIIEAVRYPSCTEPGKLDFICEICQYGAEDVMEVPARGHNWIDATCTEPKHCGRCQEVEDPALLSHNYVDGKCSMCGKVYNASQGLLMYEVTDEQGNVIAYAVGGRGECTDAEILIPYVYNGLPVVRISNGAFDSDTILTSIVIPDSVTEIGQMAFFWCTSLKSVTLPAGITRIENQTFYYCTSLESFVIPEGVVWIDTYAFAGCYSLRSLILPNSLEVIESYAFMDSGLESIVIPDGVQRLSYQTFQSCRNLKYVDLGCLTDLGNSSFYYCSSLETIVFPEGITRISNAFGYCDSLQYLVIPDGVVNFGYGAFEQCVGLQIVVLPVSVQSVQGAFGGCNNIWHVLYQGSQAQWEQVIYYNDYWLNRGTIHFDCTGDEITDVQGQLCILCHPTGGHSFGDWENQWFDQYHVATCACGATAHEDHAFGEGVITQMPTVYNGGWMQITCAVCGYMREEYLPPLMPTDRLENEGEDVHLEVIPGSDAVIDENTVLTVAPVEGSNLEELEALAGANIQLIIGETGEMVSAYDISLMLQGAAVQPGGMVAITLPALPAGVYYEALTVVYVDDEGNLTTCDTTVNDDGTITFITNHFSCYAVLITPLDAIRGDVDGDGDVDSDDAIYLLYYTFLPEEYAINQSGDMDGDGDVDSDDAIYLLYYTFLPDEYPLH